MNALEKEKLIARVDAVFSPDEETVVPTQESKKRAIQFLYRLIDKGQGIDITPHGIYACLEGGVEYRWVRRHHRIIELSFFNTGETLLCSIDNTMMPKITAVDQDRIEDAVEKVLELLGSN